MKLSAEDRLMLNYIASIPGEYGDTYIEDDNRADMYWSVSSVRRHSLLFYPFEKGSELLVVGDRFGALTGIACEKAASVDTVVPTKQHAEAIEHRYSCRKNLNIYVREYDDWHIDKTYPYVLINLDYTYGYNINDTYEFDRTVKPAVSCLRPDGRLLLSARGECLWTIKRLLYEFGFYYWQECDPLGNGALFVEASRIENLSKWKLTRPTPLIYDKWVRSHWIPGRGGELFDQDQEQIDKVVEVQADLLKKLVEVCEKETLMVYPMYGTLLGIVRDGGMILGDDDVDVAMPRADYDKLMQMTDRFNGKYFLQTPSSDDCFYGGYTKLRNTETTAIHPQNEWTDACEGIGIDIFPLDVSYADVDKESKKRKKIRFLQRLLYAKSYGYFREFKDMPLLKWKFYKYLGKPFDRDKMIKKLNVEMCRGDREPELWAIYCHYGNGSDSSARYLAKRSFKKTIPLLYEGVSMQVPCGWDELLRGLYGEGYCNRQGFSEGKRRHGFYDVDVPYTVYKHRFGGLKHPENIKEPVVLFGDGGVFKACLSYYKERVNIAHLVQLPGEEAMKPVMGIPVESWEQFNSLNVPKNSYRAVICSGDAREAEKILIQAGYEDYYIFWYNRDWMLYANQTQIWHEVQQLR